MPDAGGCKMQRRHFITLFGVATFTLPSAAKGQQDMPVIGLLNSRSLADTALLLTALRRGMAETGYIEGQNISVQYRWAEGQYDRLPALAAELANRPVALLIATGGE